MKKYRNVMDNVMKVMFIVGVLILKLSTVIGVGYLLYLWGSCGLELKSSLWQSFIFWLETLGVGTVLILPAIIEEEFK